MPANCESTLPLALWILPSRRAAQPSSREPAASRCRPAGKGREDEIKASPCAIDSNIQARVGSLCPPKGRACDCDQRHSSINDARTFFFFLSALHHPITPPPRPASMTSRPAAVVSAADSANPDPRDKQGGRADSCGLGAKLQVAHDEFKPINAAPMTKVGLGWVEAVHPTSALCGSTVELDPCSLAAKVAIALCRRPQLEP